MEREDRLKIKLKYTLLVMIAFALYVTLTLAVVIKSPFFYECFQRIQEPYLLIGDGVTVSKIILHTLIVALALILATMVWILLFALLRFIVLAIQVYTLRKRISKDEIRGFFEWDLDRKIPFYKKTFSWMLDKVCAIK